MGRLRVWTRKRVKSARKRYVKSARKRYVNPARKRYVNPVRRRLMRWQKVSTRRAKKLRRGVLRTRRLMRKRVITPARRLPKWRRRMLDRRLGLARERTRVAAQLREDRSATRAWDEGILGLARDRSPIVIGPWTSGVGYEVLYWIPLLRQAFASHGIDPDRVVAVSRGGVAPWYAPLAARYVDVLDLVSPEQLVAAADRRIADDEGERQLGESYEDVQLVRESAAALGIEGYRMLHPAAMYHLLTGYLRGLRPAEEILRRCDHSTFPDVHERPADLPFDGDYLVAKFYGSAAFPATAENRALVDGVLARLSARLPVVVLTTGVTLDHHDEFAVPDGPDIYDARELMTPRDNLTVQTALTARSRGLVGTYGGFSYLGPLVGVPSLGIYSAADLVPSHLTFAVTALNNGGGAGFSAVHSSVCESLLERFGAARRDAT